MITSEEFHAWIEGEMDKLEAAAQAKFGEDVNLMMAVAISESGGQGTTSVSLTGDPVRFVRMGEHIVSALATSVAECLLGEESGKVVDMRAFKKGEVQ